MEIIPILHQRCLYKESAQHKHLENICVNYIADFSTTKKPTHNKFKFNTIYCVYWKHFFSYVEGIWYLNLKYKLNALWTFWSFIIFILRNKRQRTNLLKWVLKNACVIAIKLRWNKITYLHKNTDLYHCNKSSIAGWLCICIRQFGNKL